MNGIVIALFALVAVCQAGILPLSAGIIGGPTAISVNSLGVPGLIASPWAAAPIALASPVIAVPTAAEYVAANRGSVHVAPLPGHVIGSQQLNLSPAPGTL